MRVGMTYYNQESWILEAGPVPVKNCFL
jgi:hypothetical protein